MRTIMPWALAPLAVLLLAGCGGGQTAHLAPTDKTLGATVQADSAHAALARVVTNAGLDVALAGVGPYTLFAPPDAALKVDFADAAMKAEDAALLRAHLAPGTLTRADISSAIDHAPGKSAQIRTLSGELLTFTRQGKDIIVTAPDGARARLTGAESLVSNGALQPVDALLLNPDAAQG